LTADSRPASCAERQPGWVPGGGDYVRIGERARAYTPRSTAMDLSSAAWRELGVVVVVLVRVRDREALDCAVEGLVVAEVARRSSRRRRYGRAPARARGSINLT